MTYFDIAYIAVAVIQCCSIDVRVLCTTHLKILYWCRVIVYTAVKYTCLPSGPLARGIEGDSGQQGTTKGH